ncbi:oxidoreductase [Paractinoplanes lichenicola]|nr:oxidoreductase [Actinoplanes lichenicola]
MGAIYVVTGANSGLGFATAKALTDRGAHVIMGVRDGNKGREARARLTGGSSEVRVVDLADLDSVRAFADGIERVDVLINNAGVMGLPRTLSAQGFEMQFAVNHLAHFALTGLLLDRIADRVVTVSSTLHKQGRLNFDDLNAEHGYRHGTAYNQSKLANVVFGLELQRRLAETGSSLRSVLAHPGYAATSLQAKTQPGLYRTALLLGNRILAASADDGARPTVFAATDASVRGGQFIGPGGLGEMRGAPRVVKATPAAADPATARRLWSVSEEMTGVRYLSATRSGQVE